jgi:(2Fe-2S) ferredoxin
MPYPRHHILVCTNERPPDNPKGCCKAKGSHELFLKIKEAVFRRGLRHEVFVSQTSCLKSCPFGPTVAVWPQGAIYGPVDEGRIDRLLDSVTRGETVQDWLVPADEVGRS